MLQGRLLFAYLAAALGAAAACCPSNAQSQPSAGQAQTAHYISYLPMRGAQDGFNYSDAYPTIQFKTNVANQDSNCNFTNGVGCVVPPSGAAFYPFYSQLGPFRDRLGSGSACLLAFGNDIPGLTTNDFGKDAEFGSYTFIAGYPFGNFGPVIPNPCIP